MQRRIEQPDNSANESTEGPQHLPEGQYYVEKLLAKRRKVSIVYLYIITVSHCTKLCFIYIHRDQKQNFLCSGVDIPWMLVLGSVLQT